MPGYFHNDWITYKALVLYRGLTPPDPSKYQLCLSDDYTLTRSSPLKNFINAELLVRYGYDRVNVAWADNGSYSNANKRHDLPVQTAIWTADGASIQFQTAFLLADAHTKADESFTTTDVDLINNKITIADNLLAASDQVIFQPEAGAVLPSPLIAGDLYVALNPVSGDFQVAHESAPGVVITLSDAGTGNFRMKYATGRIVAVMAEAEAIAVPDGRTLEYDLFIAEVNAAYGLGV